MESAISGHLYLYHDLLTDGVLQLISSAGFRWMELWAMEPHFPYRHEDRLARIAGLFEENSVSVCSAHLPLYEKVHPPKAPYRLLSPSDPDEACRAKWLDEAATASRAALELGATVLTLHTDLDRGNRAEREKYFHESMEKLMKAVNLPKGSVFAVENGSDRKTGAGSLMRLIDDYPADKLGITLDVGHAHMEGDLLTAVRTVGPRLKSVHAHDNDSKTDDHLIPGEGDIPWKDLKKTLTEVDFRGPFVYEIRDPTFGNDLGLAEKSKMMEDIARFDDNFSKS